MQVQTILNACRSILQHSSAIFARNASPARTIYGLTCARILMSDRLFVLCVGKHLHVSMTVKGTRVCIPARRSSSVKGTCQAEDNGVAAADSLVLTLWGAISDQKRAGCASNHLWMKNLKSAIARYQTIRNNSHPAICSRFISPLWSQAWMGNPQVALCFLQHCLLSTLPFKPYNGIKYLPLQTILRILGAAVVLMQALGENLASRMMTRVSVVDTRVARETYTLSIIRPNY